MKVSPSLLAADFYNLEKEIKRIKKSNCEYLHLDVMDGSFVPNISFGPGIIKTIRPYLDLTFDCHLMINNPGFYLERFKEAGADILTYHLETNCDHFELIKRIHDLNMKAGLSIKPKTDVKELLPYLKDLDLVLIMSVEPGFGGQKFMKEALPKIKFLSEYKKSHHLNFEIEVDGGINYDTALECKKNGADTVVAGTYLFKNDLVALVKELQEL